MFTRVEFKLQAKEKLRGNWSYMAGLNVIILILTGIAGGILGIIPLFGSIIAMFITMPLQFSNIIIAIRLYKEQDIPVNTVFSGFQFTMKAVGLSLWMSIWILLWSLLLFIPGIIKSYSYSLAYYCLINNPELTIREALKESIRITNGYKADLFVLDLSWIGWSLLAGFTCGIGLLFLSPYQLETKYIAFRFLKEHIDGFVNEEERFVADDDIHEQSAPIDIDKQETTTKHVSSDLSADEEISTQKEDSINL